MRAIDADALIEKCGDWYVEEGTESGFIGTLENLLVTQPTITPEPHWIPVTERLPEKEGRYLVTNSKIGAWRVDVDFYRPYMGGWMYDQGVTAWMPLPEPFKGATS